MTIKALTLDTGGTILDWHGGISRAFAAPVFNEFVVRTPLPPEQLNARLSERGFLGGLALGDWYPELPDGWLVCVTEARTRGQIDAFVEAVKEAIVR